MKYIMARSLHTNFVILMSFTYKLLVMENECKMQLACMQKPYNIVCIKIPTRIVRSRRIKK